MNLYDSEYITVKLPESIERALQVAKAANKPLVIMSIDRIFYRLYSNPEIEKFRQSAKWDSVEMLKIKKPCPCGYFGHQAIACRCDVIQIEKHQYHLRKENSDSLWCDGWISLRNITFKTMNGACKQLAKHAWAELKIGTAQLITIIETAKAIADIDSCSIRPEHLAEAIFYRYK